MVYVDDARIPYRGLLMAHMWSPDLAELLAMAEAIGVDRGWLQRPPVASWVHFDVCGSKRAWALALGAVPTDRYGPLEYIARLAGDRATLARIARLRARPATSLPLAVSGEGLALV